VGPVVLVALGIVALAILTIAVWKRWRRARALSRKRRAVGEFDVGRPGLEGEFLAAAAATGKPRGLRWTGCRLDGTPTFAVDRTIGELFALVGATVSFEAIEGGDMEDVAAVSNLRAATAVFVHRDGRWTTDGRVVFNLDPPATVNHYRESLAPFDARAERV
jgi:hypothetical protein